MRLVRAEGKTSQVACDLGLTARRSVVSGTRWRRSHARQVELLFLTCSEADTACAAFGCRIAASCSRRQEVRLEICRSDADCIEHTKMAQRAGRAERVDGLRGYRETFRDVPYTQ